MSVIEMRVNMDCAGCENKIRKALKKVEGVDDVDVDMDMQKVTVMGWADQRKVLKAVRKTGRSVELWPYPYNPESYYYYQQYYYQQPVVAPTQPVSYYYAPGRSNAMTRTYNYENQQQYYNYNYNVDSHGYYQRPPYSTTVDEQASSVFSDENAHACSIM